LAFFFALQAYAARQGCFGNNLPPPATPFSLEFPGYIGTKASSQYFQPFTDALKVAVRHNFITTFKQLINTTVS
jgi:hypothetical protein